MPSTIYCLLTPQTLSHAQGFHESRLSRLSRRGDDRPSSPMMLCPPPSAQMVSANALDAHFVFLILIKQFYKF
jgi:hypothetical protein